MRPDGYPAIYATVHRTYSPAVAYYDWWVAQAGLTRDLDLNLSLSDFETGVLGFHGIESTPTGRLDDKPTLTFKGFEGIAAATWRGQVVLLGAVQNTAPAFVSSSILLYRSNHWQPLQERLDSYDSFPARGMVYNRTWEPYASTSFGWTVVNPGFFSRASVESGATIDGGYGTFSTVAAGGASYYEDTSLPGSLGGFGAAARFVVRAVLGGDPTSDDIAFRLRTSDGVNAVDFSVRVSLAGVTHTFTVRDNNGLVDVGSFGFVHTGSPPRGNFVECLLSVSDTGTISVYGRSYDPDNDPELNKPYELIAFGVLVSASGPTDLLRIGNLVDFKTSDSDWKTAQIQRKTSGNPSLAVQGTTFLDTDGTTLVGVPESAFSALADTGLDGFMRTSQLTAVPPQYITGGVSATFRGEATLTGNYGYETAYDYSRDNLLQGPVVQEWRNSNNTSGVSEDIEILIDVGSNMTVKPTGLAIFGRNWTSCRLQMNETNVWSSPRVDVTYGTPNDLLTPDRYTHMWSSDETLFTTAIAGRQLRCIRTADSVGPWRAHQFKSQETGPWYYVMIQDVTGDDPDRRMIYRILDNDEGLLTLDGDPEADGLSALDPINFDIFSDRFAVFLGDRHSVLNPTYRFIKLTVYGVNHRGPDEDFQRIGRIVLGYAHDMSRPMFDWGWSRAESSGSSLATGSNGVRYATRNHSPRRQFNCTYRLLRAPVEADEVSESPASSWRSGQTSWLLGGGGSPKTWGHVVDLLRRLEQDGKRCALVWDGDRADETLGATSAVVQTAADPMELLMVRVTNVGALQHVAYEAQDMNLADGDECKPTAMMTQTYTFEEDF